MGRLILHIREHYAHWDPVLIQSTNGFDLDYANPPTRQASLERPLPRPGRHQWGSAMSLRSLEGGTDFSIDHLC
ncbi:hypothetical protein ACK1CN_21815 [Vibrio coralliilyticus]|uniref:hypothetical protein n=1 Tax=Vibrio TaxID=662 RepID=UPI001147711E|nr:MULTISPECIES: hypothetical protein [Vibrio]NOI77462.1 hypothetical protein [Vibrio coralliilyticus]NRF33062.1 hypothetical protein [Vibrio coralliilyticus]NRF55524.1 hypothetical protein [Vibrio coralliilyticus]QIJ87749.1 hypothetical protein G3U99_26090 [Vibrio coralliilyticus OCN008]